VVGEVAEVAEPGLHLAVLPESRVPGEALLRLPCLQPAQRNNLHCK
jgi:hypothetical protein